MARIGATLSLIACVLALLVLARGWTGSIESMIGPDGEGLQKGSPAYAETPAAKADEAEAASNIATLLREAQYSAAAVSSSAVSAQEMAQTLADSEPAMPVGKPIDRGGLQVSVAEQGAIVVICARPAYYYCRATDLRNRAMGQAEESSLAAARASAVKVMKSRSPGGSSSSSPVERAKDLEGKL